LSYLGDLIKRLLIFSEPVEKKPFILEENPDEGESDTSASKAGGKPRKKKNEGLLLRLWAEAGKGSGNGEKGKDAVISRKLSDNLNYIKKRFFIPENSDMIIREFDIVVGKRTIPAFMFFYDGMTDRKVIDDDILQPLMLLSNLDIKNGEDADIAEYIKSRILPHNQIKEVDTHQAVIDEVTFGGCGIYVDGINTAFAADVKNFPGRSVEKPNTELVIRGPQEGFNESLRDNTAMVRKRLKDEKLLVEDLLIGARSKTPCSLMYIKDIANDSLVKEVRRRLKNVRADHVLDSGELEQFIEDNPSLPVPQIIATERPDRVASMLADGRVAIFLHGSPFVLVVPITNNDIMHSAEDRYLRFPYVNLLRGVRVLAVFFSLLLPGMFIAVTNYHQEMIPTDLLLAIYSAREQVPFPTILEVLLMEISFELIREAGIRIPGPIGPTLGIIGALILGQAAVAANIVSPILIIVVAVTGIGSFAIPNFSAGFAFRILRFGFIILATLSGFLGISTGLCLMGFWMMSAKSFGVPFVAPVGPRARGGFSDPVIKSPIWKEETRPDYINPKIDKKQPEKSRGWAEKDMGEGKDDGE
jgi:spore germination protein KA